MSIFKTKKFILNEIRVTTLFLAYNECLFLIIKVQIQDCLKTDTIDGPPLTCGQQSAGASSEANRGMGID